MWIIIITKNIKETGTMSPQIAANDKTVELRGEGLNPSILPGTISNTQGLPPDRGLPCSCAAQETIWGCNGLGPPLLVYHLPAASGVASGMHSSHSFSSTHTQARLLQASPLAISLFLICSHPLRSPFPSTASMAQKLTSSLQPHSYYPGFVCSSQLP